MQVTIVKQTQTRVPARALEKAVNKTLSFVKRTGKIGPKGAKTLLRTRELTLVFVNPRESQKINSQFRQKNKPTDVLSFGSDEVSSLGELVLCPSVIEKQAPRFNHTYNQELVFMVIHGVLHLLGWDHERSKKEEKLMFELQTKIFNSLGGRK